jgi:replicative DNA helicase
MACRGDEMMTSDMLPRSIESEQALIGAVLRGGRAAYEKVNFVSQDMFFYTSHRIVWRAIERIYQAGMQIDVIVVGDEIERMNEMNNVSESGISGRAYLARLRSNGDPRNVETYAEQVQDYHIKRHLFNFSSQIASWSANGRRAKDIVADVERELAKISLRDATDEYTVAVSDAVSQAWDWAERASRGEIVGVPTGLTDIDKIIGTMINGNVYIVAGRPGTGKTAFAVTVALNQAKRGKRIGIFSLEMSSEQVAMRLVAQDSGVDLQNIIQGKMTEDEWERFTASVEHVASLGIVINDLSNINISQIRQAARKIQAENGLDLLIVDYVQLANADKDTFERREQEVSAVSRGLKYLARELNVPVLAMAQLSRAVEQRTSRRPLLSDLRESGSLEQDAYCVIFLYREEDTKTSNVSAEIAKHRNGPVGGCTLYFNAPIARFENAAVNAVNFSD